MGEILVGDRKIGPGHPPFVIAEMSGNHNQSLNRALEIVGAAKEAGVDALKMQTYTPETMTLDIQEKEFMINETGNLWRGKSLYQIYKKAYTPWEWHEEIFNLAHQLGLIIFSSPFDETAIDFLEELNPPCYKIASFEIVDLPLIKKAAATGKPLIISAGMATVAEIADAVKAAEQAGCKDLILLKCTSTYPAPPEYCNLLTIPHMQELFNCQAGLSDHTLGIGVAVAGVALGATVIEKHFTLSRSEAGVDAPFSLEPEEMRQLVSEAKRAWQALGKVSYGPTPGEKDSLKRRRSLYVIKDMEAGEEFTEDNLGRIRPGIGLEPKYYDILIGKKVVKSISKGTPVDWGLI
ncbi:MAG: pseudaminic acid synthase [Peptococcaceae bacterium]